MTKTRLRNGLSNSVKKKINVDLSDILKLNLILFLYFRKLLNKSKLDQD